MDAYPITSEDPVVRRKFADSIFEILRPLTASEMPRSRTSTDDESSQCSALSDPFSDLDETYVMLDQRKKKPGSDEGDEMLLMNQFTPEFRSTYDELMGSNRLRSRAEVSVENSLDKCTTPRASEAESKGSFVDIRSGDFSPKFRSFIDEMLAKCDLQHHLDEKKRKEQQQHKKDRRVRTIVSEESFCGLETDSLSGIWRMLDAVSEDERELLPVSGPNYDLYYDRRFDWMTRDEIPWEQVEASKKKCEQWLKIPVISTTDSLKPK
ncbi:uncharacterized protein LOC128268363 [Anopheles cruzii]|uniref:uncharacterized protein LOC128268363 n=1 Tax=Anopheles cruzii TaxID=68878 RepID=UPI0022EC951F|nr:uncharacterized protein LOC128268363 [Anopheles cruzii]